MSPPDEPTTNPRIVLEELPVSEGLCRDRMEKLALTQEKRLEKAMEKQERRTGEMISVQTKTLSEVQDLGKKFDSHEALHKGKELAKSERQTTGQYWMRMIALIFALAVAVGGSVWAVATIMQPDPVAIAKAMKELPP